MIRLISVIGMVSLFHVSFGFSVYAQTTVEQQKQTQVIRARVRQFGLGERVKVTALLHDGTAYKGFVRDANENDFVVVDNQGSPHVIRYADVRTIKSSRGLSTGAKIAIGAAIGAGAVLAVLGLIIASDN